VASGPPVIDHTLSEHRKIQGRQRINPNLIKGMLEDGEPIPEPSSLDKIMADPANEDAVPFLVTVPDTKTKRVNITLPENDLETIDDYARRHKMSRSVFLLEAAKRAMTAEDSA
jgi:hypothetical protein